MDTARQFVARHFRRRADEDLIVDQRKRPGEMELPTLRATLQLWYGMVENDGAPRHRQSYQPALDDAPLAQIKQRATHLRQFISSANAPWHRSSDNVAPVKELPTQSNAPHLQENLEACALPVSKSEILRYIRSGVRLDMEQVVAMTIGYLSSQADTDFVEIAECDEFYDKDALIVDELVGDPATAKMLRTTCMWREADNFQLARNAREAAKLKRQTTVLSILHWSEGTYVPNTPAFTNGMQQLRRKRAALQNTQRLTLPKDLLPEDSAERALWSFANNYRLTKPQTAIPTDNPQVIPKRRFNRIQRLLSRIDGRMDKTSVYVRDVETLIAQHGALSSERLRALEETDDAAAIAFGFVAAMRHRQLKVVSDPRWTRFLEKGEGRRLLQNSPDVLTSFEGILVWHATDLVALTAVRCPEGVRDHFSSAADIRMRTRKVCELMERYVTVFGDGDRTKLVFSKGDHGGSGRGPVDLYNALCDELKDCRDRARAAGVELEIGPVHKFLAKDIMYWNNGWKDDAFADGKVPGWVAYLDKVRAEEMDVEE